MISRISALIEKAKDEAEALRLMSYHGSSADEEDPTWYADLTIDDVDGIAALLRRCVESSALMLEVVKANTDREWSAAKALAAWDDLETYCAEHLPTVQPIDDAGKPIDEESRPG